jgi:DNA-binding transcriptional MocR family regulator
VLPELDEVLRASWPFPAEDLTVVDGAMDALDRVTAVAIRLGDRVVVEHPTFPPLLDLLDLVGADVLSVDVDEEGIVPDQLAAVLRLAPTALFLQPRAHNPTGATTTAKRAGQLAALLGPTSTLVIEDDHSGDVGASQLVSIGRWLPARTVHIRSYSKSHGPDLRLAAVGGAGHVVGAMANRRLLGPGWSSRILQAVLLELLRSPVTATTVAAARREYAARRRIIETGLAAHGVAHSRGDGINLWMGVHDQRSALLRLAARGIGVSPGDPFMVRPDAAHVRVTVGLVADHAEAVAEQLALAALSDPTPRRSTLR